MIAPGSTSWRPKAAIIAQGVSFTSAPGVSITSALTSSKVIVFAWVNDEDTRRAYESSDDAYRVFRKMLKSGHPPDDWNQLLAAAQAEGERMQRFAKGLAP